MTEHLSASSLSALVDGELARAQWTDVQEHLDGCPSCASEALNQALLKTATRDSGLRYTPSEGFEARLRARLREEGGQDRQATVPAIRQTVRGRRSHTGWAAAWAAAVALLAFFGGWRIGQQFESGHETRTARTAMVSEVADLHIATLARTLPPDVLSSDRHTVKPWFQGKIPFAFNLPEALPPDTTLEGANLSYLGDQPSAQLLYRIGQHRASVFVRSGDSCNHAEPLPLQQAGFQLIAFRSGSVCGIAISDVDRTRLVPLVGMIERAQTPSRM